MPQTGTWHSGKPIPQDLAIMRMKEAIMRMKEAIMRMIEGSCA